jgi:D-alanine-D-alanine ligase
MKTRVAVFYGGRSPEHDVSVYTGLNALESLDPQRYSGFPVYVSPSGEWLVGDALRDRNAYIPRGPVYQQLESVTLDIGPTADGKGRLLPRRAGGLFSKPKAIEFDVALLAFHGSNGEDGCIQGLFQVANVPYTGMRLLASTVFMDKSATKRFLAGTGIGMLPCAVLDRPSTGLIPSAEDVQSALGGMSFPVIVKPMHLGSSIGVSMASSVDEVRAALPAIYKLDDQAILEPFVENLVEYNVAVRRVNGAVTTSAIERPEKKHAVLDFKDKYGSGNDDVTAVKRAGVMNRQTLAGTREINPPLAPEFEAKLRQWATACYATLGGTGAPRIDFLSNKATGELWLNEVNPCPGWYGFFLWEASAEPILYVDLLSALIDEALACFQAGQMPGDPVPVPARLFEGRQTPGDRG